LQAIVRDAARASPWGDTAPFNTWLSPEVIRELRKLANGRTAGEAIEALLVGPGPVRGGLPGVGRLNRPPAVPAQQESHCSPLW
jgi:hypothetical protein